jgi:hypothetical protein
MSHREHMHEPAKRITRTVLFSTSDGSVFYVGAHGDGLHAVVAVQWRGTDLCPDCFLDELDADERGRLEALIEERGVREM